MSTLVRLWNKLSPAAAFEACVRPHLERLWRLALRLQGNPEDAEDLMQELLVRAWEHRAKVLEIEAPGPWLARVLYRLHVDRWRRRGVLGEAILLEPWDQDAYLQTAGADNESLLASVDAETIMRVIATLPHQQRAVLMLHDGEGYSLEEIGYMVDAPVGTVKSRLHRARGAVREQMMAQTQDHADSLLLRKEA